MNDLFTTSLWSNIGNEGRMKCYIILNGVEFVYGNTPIMTSLIFIPLSLRRKYFSPLADIFWCLFIYLSLSSFLFLLFHLFDASQSVRGSLNFVFCERIPSRDIPLFAYRVRNSYRRLVGSATVYGEYEFYNFEIFLFYSVLNIDITAYTRTLM